LSQLYNIIDLLGISKCNVELWLHDLQAPNDACKCVMIMDVRLLPQPFQVIWYIFIGKLSNYMYHMMYNKVQLQTNRQYYRQRSLAYKSGSYYLSCYVLFFV